MANLGRARSWPAYCTVGSWAFPAITEVSPVNRRACTKKGSDPLNAGGQTPFSYRLATPDPRFLMKVGIAGFAGCGKSTVFQWLTGVQPDPAAIQRGQIGMAKIPDERLDWLSAHFHPKKTTPATIEFLDTPGLLPTERKDNPRRLGILREAGGLLIVLSAFGGTSPAEIG